MIATKAFQCFLNSKKIYKYNELPAIFENVRKYFRFAYSNRKHKYFDVPAAFDIETTSFIDAEGNKAATMYEWTFGIYGLCIIGRTWDEFDRLMKYLSNKLQLNINKRLLIFCHNLSFEFQWIRKRFHWEEVFSVDNRTPVFALTTTGIEFRCSYILSGYSLLKVGEHLMTFKVSKLEGYLDYNKPRHSKTKLTKKEKAYCINDVKVVMAYIAERIMESGSIAKLPLTKTGYVRTYCRNTCFYDPDLPKKGSVKRLRYKEIINRLTLDVDTYDQLKRAFQGGYTHANANFTGTIVNDVVSYDFTSSYPTVMIAERFPMSAPEVVEIKDLEDFEKNIQKYCCLFDITFNQIESIFTSDDYISRSRCWGISEARVNNGRVHSAASLSTTLTEQDYIIIKKCYKWKSITVSNFRRFKKDYLPTDFIKSILKLYEDKTTLKGVPNKEAEYLSGKEMLNSTYGMSVYDQCKDTITYFDEWGVIPVNKTEAIAKYNKSPGRFLYYAWGVWVTAYARRNLWSGIFEFENDYLYSDTDSIKVINEDVHKEYINTYNETIRKQLYDAMDYHGIPRDKIEPKTIKGIKKCLGVWDFDGSYSRFKALGAKRYMVEYSNDERNAENIRGKITLTVSGLNKKKCIPYLKDLYGDRIFENFTNKLHIPAEHTGKLTHTYIDEEKEGILTDYNGVSFEYHEKTAVHLAPAEYSLSLANEYIAFLKDINGGFIL